MRDNDENGRYDESQVRFLPSTEVQDSDVTGGHSAASGSSVGSTMEAQLPPPSLPAPLRVLYSLNGATLALPMTALMYIVNTRAEIPVAYLSAYGAVAFLPFSLKPLYAYLTDSRIIATDHLLGILLLLSGMTAVGTASVPRHGIVSCFVFAFLRGITSAWAEFLLGMCLIRHAATVAQQTTNSYETTASLCQSQAATARNLGSLAAHLVAFLVFADQRYEGSAPHELSHTTVTALLSTTGILHAIGSIIVWQNPVHAISSARRGQISRTNQAGPDGVETDDDISAKFSDFKSGHCRTLVLLQTTAIVLAMREPISSVVPSLVWHVSFLLLGTALVLSVVSMPILWKRVYRVGIFLILRNAIPKTTYFVDSYVYSLFESSPMILQFLSVSNMGVAVLSTWSYGKALSHFSHGKMLVRVIVGTTVVCSILSLGNLVLLSLDSAKWSSVLVLLAVTAVLNFSSEWKFLPEVILATTTVGTIDKSRLQWQAVAEMETSSVRENEIEDNNNAASVHRDTSGIEYGTLISCIDFGSQIGAWAAVPLVAALGISRDNDWKNLDVMICFGALFGLLSVGLIYLLRDRNN